NGNWPKPHKPPSADRSPLGGTMNRVIRMKTTWWHERLVRQMEVATAWPTSPRTRPAPNLRSRKGFGPFVACFKLARLRRLVCVFDASTHPSRRCRGSRVCSNCKERTAFPDPLGIAVPVDSGSPVPTFGGALSQGATALCCHPGVRLPQPVCRGFTNPTTVPQRVAIGSNHASAPGRIGGAGVPEHCTGARRWATLPQGLLRHRTGGPPIEE